ncbi:MAG: acetate/propionate family kinase [Byssovorax sp.]
MLPPESHVLTINSGSSSIRFALYHVGATLERRLRGKADRAGHDSATFTLDDPSRAPPDSPAPGASAPGSTVDSLLDWLERQPEFGSIQAVGHRVVHGMTHVDPERITPDLLDDLRRVLPVDPDHLPREIALIEAFSRRHPDLPQVACFDTAFHRAMPRVATLLPIPRRYEAKGVHRYGFHGLSYAYLMDELARLGVPAATKGRVILAHLGSGASMAAVRDGQSIDTSMGFTPTAGLVMATRSGDLDPSLAPYLARTEQQTPAQFHDMVNHASGLLGVSETSGDVRDLLACEATDARAAEALALFCYQAKKWIGSLAAALGGLDALVFTGGIGESSAVLRERICDGLGFLGVEIDPGRNADDSSVISPYAGPVQVRIIRADEELMIARSVVRILNLQSIQGS